MRIDMSRFPYDFIIHFFACFIPVYILTDWRMAVVVGVYMGYLEYAQKSYIWYYELSWRDYLIQHSLQDITANVLGIVMGFIL